MGDRLEDMICDLGQESFQQAYAPMYEGLQSDSKNPLCTGCKNSLTLLSAVLSLKSGGSSSLKVMVSPWLEWLLHHVTVMRTCFSVERTSL